MNYRDSNETGIKVERFPIRLFEPVLRLVEYVQHVIYPNDWPAYVAAVLGQTNCVSSIHLEVKTKIPLGELDTLRIAFAADFHAGPTTHRKQISQAATALRNTPHDILLLGGDFVSVRTKGVDQVIEQLQDIRPKIGRFAVLGNHDHWANVRSIREKLLAADIRVLINEIVDLPPPFRNVRLYGMDDFQSGKPSPPSQNWNQGRNGLVLMHAPSGLLDLKGASFQLAFAGHTHGGQIVLPFGFAPVLPSGPLSRRFRAGRYMIPDNGTLIVTRGIGQSVIPFRVGAPADVVFCTLRYEPEHQHS